MTRRAIAGTIGVPPREYWRGQIAEHERSGMSVQRFCELHGLKEQSFYHWRKRLRQDPSMRFALVETGSAGPQSAIGTDLELVLATGERLRIGAGVDPVALRRVLEALRA
jgi:transposase-like protein